MTDARRIEILRKALKVLYTWAAYDGMSNQHPMHGRCLKPEHVLKLCWEALAETDTKKEKP